MKLLTEHIINRDRTAGTKCKAFVNELRVSKVSTGNKLVNGKNINELKPGDKVYYKKYTKGKKMHGCYNTYIFTFLSIEDSPFGGEYDKMISFQDENEIVTRMLVKSKGDETDGGLDFNFTYWENRSYKIVLATTQAEYDLLIQERGLI